MDALRPDPEQLLQQAHEEEEYQRRGRLKVFLGYSSGVGKSFRILDEGRRRHERGQDVVVGAVQDTHATALESGALPRRLEVIPMRAQGGLPAIDVVAILRRRPEVCLVDGLAHVNPPDSASAHRWQDVETLLEAGISVLTSVNLQFIAEYAGAVERITGKRVDDTVPESFLRSADEIEVVDAPAQASVGESDGRRQQQLSELRELALLLAADVVDQQLERYLRRHRIEPAWGAQERILVCVSGETPADAMIASGQRNAQRFHGELLVAHVRHPDQAGAKGPVLEHNLQLAREAGADIHIIESRDFAAAMLSLARARGVTQIFLGHPAAPPPWWRRWRASPLDRLIARAEDVDIRIFPLVTPVEPAHG